MRELSLFSGAGGGLLGTKLLGFTHIGYVEYDKYCQQVIAQRIKDGYLDKAPIFSDVREFAHIAKEYRGFADLVTAGFPCQPFSVAGGQKGENDERDMWPATRDVIRAVRPGNVFLENVPNILVFRYFGGILRDLAEMGYVVRWGCISAAACGGIHKRERLWVLAYTERNRLQGEPYARGTGCGRKEREEQLERLLESQGLLAVSSGKGGGVHDDVAFRVDRLKAIGNGQVPIVVKTAWEILNE